jgi:hypothetical protein
MTMLMLLLTTALKWQELARSFSWSALVDALVKHDAPMMADKISELSSLSGH